jgi:acetyl-CoA C-acetyltransferase
VCGSGLKAVVSAWQAIAVGDADVAIGGGMESMSNVPHLLRGARLGVKMGELSLVDSMVHDGLWDAYTQQHMGSCAELCARERGITREKQDAFALESYRRALAASEGGNFADEIAAVTIKTRQGEREVAVDEGPARGQATSAEKLGALRTVFDPNGTVTAGNASSLNDGAAALVLAGEEVAKKLGLPVLARLVASAQHAQAPEWFTTAPAEAIAKACRKAGLAPKEVDLWEINEAFAVVSLAVNDLVGLDPARVNVHGGAIALGHPIGASGARILVTLLHAMARRKARTGGAALCIGGGEAIALLVERP